MVDKFIILKSIEEAITTKCPTSSKARKRGVGGVVGYNEKYGSDEITYPDGTVVVFDEEYGLTSVTIDGKTYDFPGSKGYDYEYDMFEYMKEQLQNMEGILGANTMYQFLRMYFDDYASWVGMNISRGLRESIPIDEISGVHSWNDVIVDGHDTVVELERTMPIDKEDYATLRVQSNMNHKSDDISKKFVSDKAHTSTTVGGDWEDQLFTFGTGSAEDSWKIINIIDKGGGATGLFAGTALRDERGSDWEAEVNFAPRQKFERLLIDEEHKIIIQRPVVK